MQIGKTWFMPTACSVICSSFPTYPEIIVGFCPQQPKQICILAGFCTAMKNSIPMMKLQPAKTVPAAKSVPALKLFPAAKVESATDKSAKVSHGGTPTDDSNQSTTF